MRGEIVCAPCDFENLVARYPKRKVFHWYKHLSGRFSIMRLRGNASIDTATGEVSRLPLEYRLKKVPGLMVEISSRGTR